MAMFVPRISNKQVVFYISRYFIHIKRKIFRDFVTVSIERGMSVPELEMLYIFHVPIVISKTYTPMVSAAANAVKIRRVRVRVCD